MVRHEWAEWALDGLPDEVAEFEVRQVLESTDRLWPRAAHHRSNGLPVVTFWGCSDVGRALIVAAFRDPGDPHLWRLIGARPMRPDEVAEFDEWEKKR